MRKDKKQLIGDEIGDEQIKLFWTLSPWTPLRRRCTN